MSNQRTSAGTAADSEPQPIVTTSAAIAANPMLCAVKVKDYKCPKCQTMHNDTDTGYNVGEVQYPKYLNEIKGSTMDGSYHDWDELHKCEKCETEYWFRNSGF